MSSIAVQAQYIVLFIDMDAMLTSQTPGKLSLYFLRVLRQWRRTALYTLYIHRDMNIVNVSVSSAAISPAHGVLKSVQTQSGGNGFFYQKTSEKQPEKK